jgi:hypothetical protein
LASKEHEATQEHHQVRCSSARTLGNVACAAGRSVSAAQPFIVAADVCTVLVDGRILLRDGVLLTLDEEALLARAAQQTHSLLGRAARR